MNNRTTTHHPRLGHEVCRGENLNHLTESQRLSLRHTLWQHGVVYTRNQHMSAYQLEQFAHKTFGPMMLGDNRYQNNKPELPDELISNHVAVLGNPLGPMEKPVEQVAWKWHHDKDALPRIVGLNMNALYIVMLHVHKVPEQDMDGNPHTTEFLDQIEAWRSFEPDRQAQLRKIKLKHFPPMFNQKQGEDVTTEYPSKAHPLVTEHELTAREGLYMGSDTAIPSGMDSQPEKACQFWHQLLDDILSSCTVYSHHWQEGDIVFWDNSQVMHRGKPYDSRKYQRIGLRLGVVAREETALRHQPG